jgi:GDP-L-fucose synthase
MQSILVTGGTGLVGNAIRNISHRYPNYEFIYISSKDYDLTQMGETIKMFQKYNPKYVLHLAACVGGLYKNMNNKVEMFEKNVSMNYNVVKCAHDFKVKKLIACLSTCIFPDKTTYPINEHMLHEGPPHPSNDAYAYAKRMLEVHCKTYRENFSDNFICIIPTNIYGKYDNFDLENGHVIPSLIHKCFLAKQQNIDFVVRGSGKPLRQFIYSEDLAILILWVFEHYDENIILSTHENDEISIEDAARMIARAYNYEERIVFDANYSDGQYKKTVCTQKLKDHFSSFCFTPIEEGIQNTVKWFIENHSEKSL